MYRLSDTGLFGLQPLELHLLICGFPRSGTTLLQLMLENALPNARRFEREVSGWRAATYAWRNHRLMISKMPHDLFRLPQLQSFYAGRRATLKTILMLRDPRDLLTSQRKTGGPVGYCVGLERWRNYYEAFCQHVNDCNTLLVRYEQLVAQPAQEQLRIEKFCGQEMGVPFDQFHSIDRPTFDTSTLNGLRPIEQSLVGRWAALEHYDRVEQALRELPELPDALVRLGYETDNSWIDAWRREARPPSAFANETRETVAAISRIA